LEQNKFKYTAFIDKTSFEVLNSEFTKAKAYILYYGENRNKSKISKESVESAIPTLYNVPVIAEWIEKKEDFGTHGGKIIISDKGVEYVQTTKPYGLVPESCNARWEMVEDKEYLVADIILWSGRYEELAKTVSEFSNQSMEINVFEGAWDKDVYDINKFEFSALCLLGQDVEPCFEQAKIVAYGLDEFKKEMDEMFKNYKCFSEVLQKGGDNLSNINNDDIDIKNLSFSTTDIQKREAINNALEPIIVRGDDDRILEETYFWLHSYNDEYIFVERNYWSDNNHERTYGRYTYTFDESGLVATITSEFEKMITDVWLTQTEYDSLIAEREKLKADFEVLQLEVENYKNSISTLETEKATLSSQVVEFEKSVKEKDDTITILQKYQDDKEFEIKQSQIEEIIADFEVTLGENDEFKVIKEKAMTYEIDALEKDLYALEGRVKHSKTNKSAKKSQTFSSKVSVDNTEPSSESYYGDAVKYIPKN